MTRKDHEAAFGHPSSHSLARDRIADRIREGKQKLNGGQPGGDRSDERAIERSLNNPWGLLGGGEARPNRGRIRHPDGSDETLIKATGAKVPKGSTFELSTGGGGGYGSPAERDPAAIEADVRAGYISREYALRHYPQYG